MSRSLRQKQVLKWTLTEFGVEFTKPRSRALRFLEEALELAQAVGLTVNDVFNLTNHVFTQPPGEVEQEFGGVGVTMLALGESLGLDVDRAELEEVSRVITKPIGYYRARQQAKAEKGVAF